MLVILLVWLYAGGAALCWRYLDSPFMHNSLTERIVLSVFWPLSWPICKAAELLGWADD